MIIVPRFIPLNVHFGQALIPRLSPDHPKIPYIEKDIRLFLSGYRGEVKTDYHLQFLDDKNHLIFRGLRLPDEQSSFQMDTLILTRSYLCIIETKNHIGEITINKEQFTQKSIYGEKGYTNPLTQVNIHKEKLEQWLEKHRLPKLPILTLVVLSNQSAIIKSEATAILSQLCKVDNVRNKLLPLTNPYSEYLLTARGLKKTAKLLLQDNTPLFPNLQKLYQIAPKSLIPGVRCPHCATFHMLRKDRVWVCPNCLTHSRMAYHDALLDYFLLVNSSISNKEFRDFIGVDKMKTATYMLAALNLPTSGFKKGRVYLRPDNFLAQLDERYHLKHKGQG